ncbi:hypothetical protein JXL19_08935 [bacterium]|nr:hypothetical protein [bacterium]
MKRWIIIGGCSLIIIFIILLIVGISNIGPLIKNAVNLYGPKITLTDLHIEEVSVSLFSGEAKLKDFHLGNPKGFKAPYAMKVKSIAVDVDEGSLTGDTIIVEKVEIISPEITYEKTKGTDNLKTILENIQKSVAGSSSASDKTGQKKGKEYGQGEEKGKKLIIRDFIINDGKVNLVMGMLEGKGVSAPLPDVHLKDIGKKDIGASATEVFEEVFASIYSKIVSPEVTEALNQGLKELGTGLKDAAENAKKQMNKVGDGAKKGTDAATGKLKGLFNKQ